MKSDPLAKSEKPVLEELLPVNPLPFSTAALSTHASPTLAINTRVQALRANGKSIVHFGFGESPFPIPAEIVHQLQRYAAEKSYLPVRGLPALREAIADYHRRMGHTCSDVHVIVGPGSKMLLYTLQAALQCPLILPSPSWVTYEPQARLTGNPVHWIDTVSTGWKIDPEDLDTKCRELSMRAMLLLNSPSNPTGIVYSPDELQAIAEVARRHDLLIISDEIYAPLTFSGPAPSIAPFYTEDTIQTGGLSKWCGAGGWRLGYAIIRNNDLMDIVSSIASETYSAVSAPIQHAAITAFAWSDSIDRYVKRATHILQVIHDRCSTMLTQGGVQVVPASGGFYIMPDFSNFSDHLKKKGIQTSDALCHDLLDASGVALLPGSAFGRPQSEFTARLAFVDFDGAMAMQNYSEHLDDTWVNAHAPRIAEGITRILEFLS